MKAKVLRKIVALVLGLFMTFSIPANAAATVRIYLLGIKDSDDGDRTSWHIEALSSLENIEGGITYRYTAFNSSQLLSYLKSSHFFVIHTHGNETSLRAVDGAGKRTDLNLSSIKGLSGGSLANTKVAFIGACECGKGGSSADNMINAIYNKGTKCVIGYTKSVNTVANGLMLKYFSKSIGIGYTVQKSLAAADVSVLAQHFNTGNTNDRLVRGDTSLKYPVKSTKSRLASETTPPQIISLTNDEGDTIGFFDFSKVLEKNTSSSLSKTVSNKGNNKNAILAKYSFDQEKYKLADEYFTEDTGLWTTIYTYKINGIPTGDSLIFVQNTNGELVSYVHTNENAFDGINLDSEQIRLAELQLEGQLSVIGITDYTVTGTYLVLKDDLPTLRYSVKHAEVFEEETYESIDDFYITLS